MYVAITRAEKYLYLSHAMKRRVYGDEMMAEPSQFLNELPLQLIEDLSRGASWLSFARSDDRTENKRALSALTGANSAGNPERLVDRRVERRQSAAARVLLQRQNL